MHSNAFCNCIVRLCWPRWLLCRTLCRKREENNLLLKVQLTAMHTGPDQLARLDIDFLAEKPYQRPELVVRLEITLCIGFSSGGSPGNRSSRSERSCIPRRFRARSSRFGRLLLCRPTQMGGQICAPLGRWAFSQRPRIRGVPTTTLQNCLRYSECRAFRRFYFVAQVSEHNPPNTRAFIQFFKMGNYDSIMSLI